MQLHDIVFVGEGAGIGQVETLIGTSTLLGGASRLVSKIGAARAKEMVFSAEIYDAKTLHAWGLINKVFPDADVEAEARTGLRPQARRRSDDRLSLCQGAHQHHGLQRRQCGGSADDGGNAADLRHGRHARRDKALRRGRPSHVPRWPPVQGPLSRAAKANPSYDGTDHCGGECGRLRRGRRSTVYD
jgi:enoyl-CoA hydratase/carnithine racemase